MIEIIAIYITSKNIAEIAKEKGYSPGLWRFLAIITWVFFEFVFVFIGTILFGENSLLLIYFFALLGAFLGYYIILRRIDAKPNLNSR
jgi:hypothetical protein